MANGKETKIKEVRIEDEQLKEIFKKIGKITKKAATDEEESKKSS
jgi:hypothetical protein